MNCKLLLLLLIIPLSGCSEELVELKINNENLFVEVANSDETRAKGLMHRDELDENSGMIFIFEKEQRVSFWMKNTKIPLSIAYIGKDGTIYEIYDMEPFSLKPIPSKRSSIKYALEVNRDYFVQKGIEVGDRVELADLGTYLNSSR